MIKNKILLLLICSIMLIYFSFAFGDDCIPASEGSSPRVTNANFNFGCGTKLSDGTNVVLLTIGQTAVGDLLGEENSASFGFWSFMLMEPQPPIVLASDGDHSDRIEIKWFMDPLSPAPTKGFKLFRNNSLLAVLDETEDAFQDFNIYAGKVYNYDVLAINKYGEGVKSQDPGFANPNGVITGTIKTGRGSPVVDAEIFLTPSLGTALSFDGIDDYVDIPDTTWFSGDFTIEAWVYLRSYNNWCRLLDFGNGAGEDNVYVALSQGTTGKVSLCVYDNTTESSIVTPDEIPLNQWTHIACVLKGTVGTIYKNGEIWAKGNLNVPRNVKRTSNYIGRSNSSADSYTDGIIDDVRIWNYARNPLQIQKHMYRTLDGNDAGLLGYWKFDEAMGKKVFDLTNNNYDGVMCGVSWSGNKAPIYTSTFSNENGEYSLRGIYYGAGTTFYVSASKEVPVGYSLTLNGYGDYVEIGADSVWFDGDFTIESWVYLRNYGSGCKLFDFGNGAGEDNVVVELSEGTTGKVAFRVYDGTSVSSLVTPDAIPLNKWVHISCVLNGTSATIYKNAEVWASGVLNVPRKVMRSKNYIGKSNWASDAYLNGMVDEPRIWSIAQSQSDIEMNMYRSLKGDEQNLVGYWDFNEAKGTQVYNANINNKRGVIHAEDTLAVWTDVTPWKQKIVHQFQPQSSRVSLDPSITSIDGVNFTDISMVPVTGFVQYPGTDCFPDSVELLVDGAPGIPKIFTKKGKFVAEFEPGTTHTLTPRYSNHTFLPVFYQVYNINKPVAGVLFYDTTKRKLEGRVAGGNCRHPIGKAKVILKATSGCYEISDSTDSNGIFKFRDLPPVVYTVTVKHPNPAIQLEGKQVSLVDNSIVRDETSNGLEFIYLAPINVEVNISADSLCNGIPVLKQAITQSDGYNVIIKIFEEYYNPITGVTNRCNVDSGEVKIADKISDYGDSTYTFRKGVYRYRGKPGVPNILSGGEHPYQKYIQVVVEDTSGRKTTETKWAYVTGRRAREQTFTTVTPDLPLFVLRDPPGDGSYCQFSKGNSITKSYTWSVKNVGEFGMTQKFDAGTEVITGTAAGALVATKSVIRNENSVGLTQSWEVGGGGELVSTLTAMETFSTSDDEKVTGKDGDVFVGGAMNMLYGMVDILTIKNCQIELDKNLYLVPGGFKTTYIYTTSHIRDVVIPELEFLKSKMTNPDSVLYYQNQINVWKQVLQKNEDAKAKAVFDERKTGRRNISFNSGASYEYTFEASEEKTSTIEFSLGFRTDILVNFDFNMFGSGIGTEMNITVGVETGHSWSTTKAQTTSYTYHFADDDVDGEGDFFSIDIKYDPEYNTPVFELKGGQSSCPYEKGTLPRDEASLTIYPSMAINVPPDEPAVFRVLVGNMSQSDEDRDYVLFVNTITNPYGAEISINGEGSNVTFMSVPAGKNVEATLTVSRGPDSLNYKDIELWLVPACEYEIGTFNKMAKATISVQFLPPCSPIAIAEPSNNWVVTQNYINTYGNDMEFTVTDYELLNAQLKQIKLQYRKVPVSIGSPSLIPPFPFGPNFTGGVFNYSFINNRSLDGDIIYPAGYRSYINTDSTVVRNYQFRTATGEVRNYSELLNKSIDILGDSDWILVPGTVIPKSQLNNTYVVMKWNVKDLMDGVYEVRAVAECRGDVLPYRSVPVRGLLDRTSPRAFGTPQPSDMVLNAGDDISITFDERIDCVKFLMNPVDNVKLINTETGEPVDFEFVCSERSIVFTTDINYNRFIENKVLRATVANLQDMYGNKPDKSISWEFFVDRNPVRWNGGTIDIVKFINEPLSFTRQISNEGAYRQTFELKEFSSWIKPSIILGTIEPRDARTITFDIDPTLPIGAYSDTIYAKTTMGDEPLILNLRVLCTPPDWKVDPTKYKYTMSITANLYFEDSYGAKLSKDVYDMVGVFVGNECRGVANVQYISGSDMQLVEDRFHYQVYLTVYSNQANGENLSFKIWNASECIEFTPIKETYTFIADSRLGSPVNPQTLTAIRKVVQKIELPAGITWFSLSLAPADMSVSSVMSSLVPNVTEVANNSLFAKYSNGWSGTLQTLTNESMYTINLTKKDTLELAGLIFDAPALASKPISITTGWNWIGYLPYFSMDVNTALSSLASTVKHGDVIKGQYGYAQYNVSQDPVTKKDIGRWIGSLSFMDPYKGYKLYSQRPGTLIYPYNRPLVIPSAPAMVPQIAKLQNAPDWSIQPNDYQYSMIATGVVSIDGNKSVDSLDVLYAFVGNECRGIAQPIYVPSANEYQIFMMIYSNTESGENITFRLFDGQEGEVLPIAEFVRFKADEILSSIDNPFVWTIGRPGSKAGIPLNYSLAQNYPNPFNPKTTIKYELPKDGYVDIGVYNIAGQKVRTLVSEKQSAGYRFVIWDGLDDSGKEVPSGIYFCRMTADGFTDMRKMVLLK